MDCRTMSIANRHIPALRSLAPRSFHLPSVSNGTRVTMRKRGIHGEFHQNAKVYCKGEHVMTVSGTQESYHVEIWSGNHPFYQGSKSAASAEDDGPLSKFVSKYEGLGDLLQVPKLNSEKVQGLEAFVRKRKKKE